MTEFAGRTAVVTGGGSGMGRELVRQLVAEACNVAMCDVSLTGLAETQRLCEAAGLPQGLRVTTHIADVSDFAQMERIQKNLESGALSELVYGRIEPALVHMHKSINEALAAGARHSSDASSYPRAHGASLE